MLISPFMSHVYICGGTTHQGYRTLDCFGYDDINSVNILIDRYLASEDQYNYFKESFLSGESYGFKGSVLFFTPERNEFIVSVCLDRNGV